MSDVATPTRNTQSATNAPRPLVRHSRRDGWGRGLMLWEREGKRGYQFEDGKVRVFAEAYFDLLQPAAKPDPVLRHRLRELAVQSGEVIGGQGTSKSDRSAGPRPTLDDQVTVFEAMFEGGFHGEAWTEANRHRTSGRRIKRLRDPAIAEARALLGLEPLQGLLEAGKNQEVLDRMLDVVGNTDLATKAQLEAFRGIAVDQELGEALVGFLHDMKKGDLGAMPRLRRALARKDLKNPAWTVLTAPRALLCPSDHMCVRPSFLRAQAKLVMPRYKPGSVPSAADYSRCLELAMSVSEHLTKAGFGPRDLFDVTDFMRVTLSPSAKEKLTEAMVLRSADEADDGSKRPKASN